MSSQNIADVINTIPAEILLKVWSFLSVKQLMKIREVCIRWRNIIDEASMSERFWNYRCAVDFYKDHQAARLKSRPGLNWYCIYRSLSLWSKLAEADEYQYDLCSAELIKDEIRSIEIIRKGIIGVHTRSAIIYYNSETLSLMKRRHITGDFLKYGENDKVTAVLSYHMFLYVQKKVHRHERPVKGTFDDVRTFLLFDHVLYYIDVRNDLYQCKLDEPLLVSEFVVRPSNDIVSLGLRDNQLYILTIDQGIYRVNNMRMSLVTTLSSSSNLLDLLSQFNFLELLDWRTYFHWMFVLKQSIPRGPLEEILIIHIYGDVVFVGCNWGVLRIYYKPYIQGQLDIFNTEPIKKYNFMDRSTANPVHCMYPILKIEAQETKDGHCVYVALPKRIVILNFTHYFETAITTFIISPSTTRLSKLK